MRKEDIAGILLDIRAVILQPDKPFTWASGIKAPIYCDNRLLISYPEKRRVIVQAFLDIIKQNQIQFDILGGVATGAIPHAAWIAEKLRAPMVYIRSEKKQHGMQNQVEGKLQEEQKVLVIEDLVSTGGSSINAVNAVREAGGIVEHCIAIFTYGFPKAAVRFQEENCSLTTLTDFPTLVKVALQRGYIKAEDEQLLLQFQQDPENWGR